LLTAAPLEIGVSAPPDLARVAAAQAQAVASAAALMPVSPFPLGQTFSLHSNPTATKTIYLDFDGFTTRNTQWNTDYKQPNIVTPAFSLDDDFINFSDDEKLAIQAIWEHVSEDYRPFDVDVTTQDPGVEALRHGSVVLPPIASTDVGQVIDGSTTVLSSLNFNGSLTSLSDINVTLNISHTFDDDLSVTLISPQGTRIQLFSGVGGSGNNFINTVFDDQATTAITDFTATPPFTGSFRPAVPLSGLNGEDPNGTWLLEVTDNFPPTDNGVLNGWSLTVKGDAAGDTEWGTRVVIGGSDLDWQQPVTKHPSGGIAYISSFDDDVDQPAFVFAADFGFAFSDIAEAASHESGHTLGLNHDGLIWFWQNSEDSSFHQATVEYYPGHPNYDPADGRFPLSTDWAPIMGVSYGKPLSQWSKGEYPGANNIEDDLLTITTDNGFGWRPDDHGDTRQTADPLELDPATIDTDVNTYFGEGIIGEHPAPGVSDVDYFSFIVEGLGEVLSFDITPFQNGPNLDILAKLYNSSGTLIATSNPLDNISAGGQTYDSAVADSGWLDASGNQVTEFSLAPGTYYISVEGTGRPITFIDPTYHPVIQDPEGAPDKPKLPFDHSDWGYSNYGSLGYYSITGIRKKGVVVGVDFDVADGGVAPANWNLYTGSTGPQATVSNLISETGVSVPYQLMVSTSGTSINTFDSDNGIAPADVPSHFNSLDDLDGFISAENQTLTFTWSHLAANTVYQLYVFGHADFDAVNQVSITGGLWNGVQQSINFTQDVSADGLEVNNAVPGNQELSTLSVFVISDENGQIKIEVTTPDGAESGIAGLAIATTKVGSISGQKWDDADGDRVFDGSEDALEGWTVYLDLNNNGQLDQVVSPSQTLTQSSTDIPQTIPDQNIVGVKSTLDFTGVGKIEDVNITLNISHEYDADLHATLISPSGTRVKLFTNVGGSGDNFQNTVLDDSAIIPIGTQLAPFTGTFRPEQPLSIFNDEDAAGQWKLELIDDGVGQVGTLTSWSLTIKIRGVSTFLEPFEVTDASGSYTFDSLPPGVYNVREFISPEQAALGWHQTWAPAPITLRSGVNLQGVNFGNWIPVAQTGSIKGQKYYDSNQNGVKDAVDAGLSDWIVYIDSNHNGVRDIATTPTSIVSTDVPKPITDSNTITSQINLSSLGTIFNIEVTLDITHSFVGDLDVFLVSPSGRSVELFTGVGGQYNDFHNLTLSDSAARSISTIGFNDVPYTGTWKPEGHLSDFGGEDAAGIWTLVVTDTDQADEGTLNSWSLSVTSGEVFRTTDDQGNYEFDSLAPGSYTIREEPKPGWVQIPPADTGIPAATWNGSGWDVVVEATDDFSDPVPDSRRNVKNVDFGNYAPTGSISGYVYRDLDASATKTPTEPGLAGWTVFLDANNNGILDTGTVDTTVSSTSAEAINNTFTVESKLYVGATTTISDIDVTLDITHTFDGDLSAYLVSPSGTRVKLFSNIGSSGDNFQGTSFDDGALQSITAGTAPFSGAFKPAELLAAFNGENSLGFWTLEIKDSTPADNGSLNTWSLTIKGDELSTVTDADGHYSFANLAPGSYYLDVVQKQDWAKTETAGAIVLLPSQNLSTANFGERPPYLQGDFNFDGIVDSADYLVWQKQSGKNVPPFSGADGDGDGDVDQADLALWRKNFGKYRDDHGNDSTLATSLVLPASRGGVIEVSNDVDWFSFTAVAGQTYELKAALGTLSAGNLQLFGTNGTTQLATNSDPSPLISWTAPTSGVYFAQVKGQTGSSVGSYTFSVAQFVVDDHGNSSATSTAVAVPSSTGGNIEITSDVDWFKFNATAGSPYNISVLLGTLPYATIRVIGADGTSTLLSTGGFGPSAQWTALATGTYFVEVSSVSTGTYTIAVALDDHGNTPAAATPIAVPSTTSGNIESSLDVDLFSFAATSGTSYRFETTLNTLNDSTISLFATDGTTELAFDDDGGSGLASRVDWTAPSSGTYFVKVAGFGSAFGTYSLAASINGPGSGSSSLLSAAGSGLSMESEPVSTSAPLSPVSFVGVAQPTSFSSTSAAAKPVSESATESGKQNDLALLAWLSNASGGNSGSASSGDSLALADSDEPDAVDIAFELLEGNALAVATI
jgi:subtilisin-like proprotein convertase family protein